MVISITQANEQITELQTKLFDTAVANGEVSQLF